MTRRTMAERKRRAAERATRRESLLVLLSRARRGVPLTPAEAALMFAHVEVELTEADELRRTVQGQQTAIQAAHDRTTAAEAAIREMEQRAVDAEEQLRAYRAVEAYRQAAADTFEGRLAAIRQQTTEGILTAAERLHERAEQAEERLAAYVDIFGPDAVDDFHAMQHRAVTAEAELTRSENARDALRGRIKRAEERLAELTPKAEADRASLERLAATLGRLRVLARRMRAGSPQGAAAVYADRIEQALDNNPDALTDQQAAAHSTFAEVAFAEAADHAEARLSEQGREHAIVLATERRRGDGWKRHALAADARADRYRDAWHNARRRAHEHYTEQQRVRGWTAHWADRYRDAEHRAGRYRTAWFAARRDRKADRAAMAAELPDVIAGQQAREQPEPAPPFSPCRRNDDHDAHEWQCYGRPFHCPGYTPEPSQTAPEPARP
jgi:chromosome segregation ATPase